jgi:hypothetical protein
VYSTVIGLPSAPAEGRLLRIAESGICGSGRSGSTTGPPRSWTIPDVPITKGPSDPYWNLAGVRHSVLQCPGRLRPNAYSDSYLVDLASSHMLVSKIKPCMSKYKQLCTVKLRMAH